MSYQVLARKWRPRTFAQVVGQQHVLKPLINALQTGRLHHAWLLTGTRGVGKTTIARILAKSLNCEQGLSAEPCGQCGACKAIEEGRFVDLLEIDAASRTKVEDTRELLDNVQYKPTQGRYKVYLIDEVHMLSKHSFNALLKNVRRATRACEVCAGDHRSAQATDHGIIALFTIQFKSTRSARNCRPFSSGVER